MDDPLVIAGRELRSRLITGTGKYPSPEAMRDAVVASGCELVTVAVGRIDLDTVEEAITDYLPEGVSLLPNTAGSATAEEAVRIARLARAGGLPDWIKLEVIPDPRWLLPDPVGTLARRRAAGRGGVHRPAVRVPRPGAAEEARGGRLCGGDAAGVADRQRPRAQAPPRDRDHGRAGRGAGRRRRRAGRAVAGGRGDGARRGRRARQHRDCTRRGSRRDGAGVPAGRRGRPLRPSRRPDRGARDRRGLEPRRQVSRRREA